MYSWRGSHNYKSHITLTNVLYRVIWTFSLKMAIQGLTVTVPTWEGKRPGTMARVVTQAMDQPTPSASLSTTPATTNTVPEGRSSINLYIIQLQGK